ncbi:hypothetical protein [Hymenobacter weizhouensis]|uniref:hypothetical protein n=1 Tax=Hymenobacter sp. YIM 151500-1 TaxID=2987689 RepID=UPI002225EE9D|nr:hypothetical protein [Hymenobacter sp. YIM 151500-1]UYZ64852.1 hypothetical protein OIS53_08380 [Hymenobacter sp. YIM 151500-1]
MAKRTEYQKQADKRTKDALRLRARFDGRIRKAAQQLITAAAGALDARNRLNRINQLYGVDISTETLLAHSVRTGDLGGQLATLLGESTPGEEVQLFNPTPDGNGGVVLALEAVFGEVLTPQASPLGPGPLVPAAPALTLTSFTHSYSAPYDNITLQVASPVPTDMGYDLSFDVPGSYQYPNLALNNAITLSLSPVMPGQVVTMTAVAASGARLTHTFTVGQEPEI